MYKKESLDKLIVLIREISEDNSNKWFLEKLTKELFNLDTPDDRINSIYELCVQRILKEQAEQFYKKFPLTEIKDELIKDFIEMERCRRANNFEGFTLATFQQIENITNSIFKNENLENWLIVNKNNPILSFYDKEEKKFKKNTIGKKVTDLIYTKSEPFSKLSFYEKLSIILYKYSFNETLKFSMNDLIEKRNSIIEINDTRNTIHRGSNPTPKQKRTKEKIFPVYNSYYLIFQGILADFILSISKSLTDHT